MDTKQTKALLLEHFTVKGKFMITPDQIVNVQGDVTVKTGIPEFPVTFGSVVGDFISRSGLLTHVKGAPRSVTGKCVLASNALVSLEGLPENAGALRLNMTPHLPLLRLLEYKGVIVWGFSVVWGGSSNSILSTARDIIGAYQGKGKQLALVCAAELRSEGVV